MRPPDRDKHPEPQRRSIRLTGYDYRQAGAYFITICAWDRLPLFGTVVADAVQLTTLGAIVQNVWTRTAVIHPDVLLDQFVVMPNHFHGILFLTRTDQPAERATASVAPTVTGTQSPRGPRPAGPASRSLGALIGQFKSVVTKQLAQSGGRLPHPIWQRGYYEHIVRDDRSLDLIRHYIIDNPTKWAEDTYNLDRDR